MKISSSQVTVEYANILEKFTQALSSLASSYAKSTEQPTATQPTFFASSIVTVLSQHPDLLNFLNQRSRQDLIDSLETHNNKYVETLKEEQSPAKVIKDFQTSVNNLTSALRVQRPEQNSGLTHQELEVIRDLATGLAQKCRILFAEQTHNQDTIDKLLGMAIAFNTRNLSTSQQIQLLDKLLLTKELWQVDKIKPQSKSNFKTEFYTDHLPSIQKLKAHDAEEALEQIEDFFVNNHDILQHLSDEKLISLYDRLKNFEPQTPSLLSMLHKIHHEAQFRYSYNRLSDSGYELLKRFQSYDAISHQIENSEFAIVETFLLRRANFEHEALMLIAKHAENLKAVGAAKLSNLSGIINHISAKLEHHHRGPDTLQASLASIKAKLASSLETHVLKRYVELDKFAVTSLKSKYGALFENIKMLSIPENDNTSFLNQVIIRRLAQDYYISNLSNSVAKLRIMADERTAIAKNLAELNFTEIFNPEHLNNFVTLNFRKQIINANIKNAQDYIHSIIKVIVANCSASQLDSIYKPLLHGELTETGLYIRHFINEEIKQRTTITKIVYSIFTGRKTEFDKLQNIKKALAKVPLPELPANTKKVPGEVKEEEEV